MSNPVSRLCALKSTYVLFHCINWTEKRCPFIYVVTLQTLMLSDSISVSEYFQFPLDSWVPHCVGQVTDLWL